MTVVLEDLTIVYGATVAVDHASANFPHGAVGLLGRNGSGKTSILKALLGLLRPATGRMQILDLPSSTTPREIRRRVGYMPEKDCWISGLNGFETVLLAAQLTGVPHGDAFRRAHEVLYLVGMEEQRYRAVAGYSAGMRQKVKLATALVHDPDILFLDEPTNGLDPTGRREMLQLVTSLVRDLGKSIILSSHILQDVENVCSSAVLLEKGKVLAAGPLAELTRSAVRVFHLQVSAAPDALRAALGDAGVLEMDVMEDGEYRLTIPEGMAMPSLFAAVARSGGAVRKLVEHRRSLEDVFVGAVRAAERDQRW